MGVWDDVLEPSVLRPRSSYGVRALVVDVASDPPKEKIIIIIIIIMNILVRNEQGQRRKKETKHKKNTTKDLVPSTHRCISDFESWTGRPGPVYMRCDGDGTSIYIYILTGDVPRHVAHTCMDIYSFRTE